MIRLKPWRVTGSRTLYEDPFVRLRGDDCVAADGRALGQYHVLDYRPWVHVVAIDAEDHMILVRQYRHGLGDLSLELPGGVIDPADADVAAAAARELREETGYVGGSLRPLATLTPNSATHANRLYGVLAEGVTPTGKQSLDPGEDIEVVRIPVAEAVGLALGGGMVHAMHIAVLMIGLQATGRLKASLP